MGLQQALERLAVTFYVISFMSGIWGWFMVPLFLFNIWTFIPFAIYLGVTWFGPLRDAHKDITWQTPLRRLAVWRYAASFYPARLHRTEELDPDANYIFAAQPHGLSVHFLTLPGHFKNPFVRDWILLHGMLDTSRATCQRIVAKGTGRCIAMAVGGARESLFVEPGTMNIILDRRLGFVRLALETGASLVPVLCFGENDLFDAQVVGAHTLMGRFQMWGLKHVGITSPNFSWLGPHRVPVNVVCGAPIKVEKFSGDITTAEGTALVAKTHAVYKNALLELYQANKDRYHINRKEELKVIA